MFDLSEEIKVIRFPSHWSPLPPPKNSVFHCRLNCFVYIQFTKHVMPILKPRVIYSSKNPSFGSLGKVRVTSECCLALHSIENKKIVKLFSSF